MAVDAPSPNMGRASVMIGRTVQSTTQRRDAMLDILRRRSWMDIPSFSLILLLLLSFLVSVFLLDGCCCGLLPDITKSLLDVDNNEDDCNRRLLRILEVHLYFKPNCELPKVAECLVLSETLLSFANTLIFT